MLTQIYEVSTATEADLISKIGVNHIGVLVGPGSFPRECSIRVASEISSAINAPAKFTTLFLTADICLISAWVRALRPAIVHLGAPPTTLTVDQVIELKKELRTVPLMRSLPVSEFSTLDIAKTYEGVADYIMLDTFDSVRHQLGALGRPHDWNISRQVVDTIKTPVLLAGGLGPENVAAAIEAVRPFGVDSKTRTDHPGTHNKDIRRVRDFYRIAQATALGLDMPQSSI